MGSRFWGWNERSRGTQQADVVVAGDGALRSNRVIDLSTRRAARVAVDDRPEARTRPGWGKLPDRDDDRYSDGKCSHARGDREGDFQYKAHGRRVGRHTDAGRHFLKFFLPIIPVMMFVFGFLYWYITLNVRTAAPSASADAMIPLMGGVLLGLLSALLCAIAYLGYLNVRDREAAALTQRARQAQSGQSDR